GFQVACGADGCCDPELCCGIVENGLECCPPDRPCNRNTNTCSAGCAQGQVPCGGQCCTSCCQDGVTCCNDPTGICCEEPDHPGSFFCTDLNDDDNCGA